MRARTFGLVLLALVGIAPLAVFGYLAIDRSEQTALAEVKQSNRRLARVIARRISAFGTAEGVLLRSIGAAALAPGVSDAQAVLESYALGFGHLQDLAIYRKDGTRVGVALGKTDAAMEAAARQALAGESFVSPVVPADRKSGERFAHTIIRAEPVVIVGAREGAVVARIDLVDVWEPVNAVRVGQQGFVRLLTFDGTLLAHGNPEERRYVFDEDRGKDKSLVAGALLGQTVENQQGNRVIASAAFVPGRDWMVVVEQPVAEAFAAANEMRRDLYLFAAGALVLVIACGVMFGRTAVRSLEKLRAHTRTLAAGDLDARIDEKAPLVEATALARSLNEMAASLKKLHDEARSKERINTFARVAAGLAHDIRNPIEAVRSAVGHATASPDSAEATRMLRWIHESELPKLNRYMDDLQRLAREGNIQLNVSEVTPRALVDQVVGELAANPKFRGVTFEADGAAPDIVLDAGLVRRAVYNLCTNAADACSSRGRGGRVWVEVGEVVDGVTLRVRDTGGGMTGEALARLLEGDFTSTKRTTGVGLGFGVARHVAQAHGGRIEGDSTVGEGSSFTLVLPRDGAGRGNGKRGGNGRGNSSPGAGGGREAPSAANGALQSG